MDEFKELVGKRKICRSRYTRHEKTVWNGIKETQHLRDSKAGRDEIKISILKMTNAMEELNKVYGELKSVQDEIDFSSTLAEFDEDSLAKEAADEERYRTSYIEASSLVQQLQAASEDDDQHDRKSEAAGNTFTPEQFALCIKQTLESVNPGISGDQLEKILGTLTHKKRNIQIPKFKGDVDLFDQWRSLIEAEVEKPGYSEVEKTHIVISLVEGDVLKLVSGLKDPTYEDLMEFLENRYGDVVSRIEKAVSDIASVPAVSSPNAKDLDALYNKLIANWNYLTKRTKDDPRLIETSWLLTALVRPKLPKSLVKRWDGEKLKEDRKHSVQTTLPMQFDVLLEKLQDAVKVARRSEPIGVSKPTKPVTTKEGDKEAKKRSTGYALSVTPKSTKQHTEESCIFCGGRHYSSSCQNVKGMSVQNRIEKVKAAKACFNCLKTNHFVDTCRASHCKTCQKNHHTLLHYENKVGEKLSQRTNSNVHASQTKEKTEQTSIKSSAGLIRAIDTKREILMQSGIARLESKSAVTQGRVLFDSGSGVSFISRDMAKKLQLRGPSVTGEFTLAGGDIMTVNTEMVKFHLSSIIPGWKGETFEIAAYVIDQPSADLNPVTVDLNEMPHLKGLQLAETFPRSKRVAVDVMLGIEDTQNILQDKRIKGTKGLPVAQRSHIGWIVSGSCPSNFKEASLPCANRISFCILNELDIATKHWELEHIGILPKESKKLTDLEKEALAQHKSKTVKRGEHYETGLIKHPQWSDKILKSNKKFAHKRLVSLEHRLSKDTNLASKYQDQINELLSNGYAERVTEEREPEDHSVWYLPHHPVVREDKATTKVRIVFDGSMRGAEGLSLNDTLLPGPALQPDLPGVLLRFRRHNVALVADVEKMFLQIGMNHDDADCQRFLWRDLDTSKEPEIYRLKTVMFGLTPSPFSSIKTVLDHVSSVKESYPSVASEVEENLFVDDILSGANTVEEVAQLAADLKTVFGLGGFRLRKFLSNKPEALSSLVEEDLASHHIVKVVGEEVSTKTLGVGYLPEGDQLMFSFFDKMEDVKQESRRTVLKQLHRVYDPLGMLSPFTLKAKQIFQKTWMTTGGWDDPLPETLEREWLAWKDQVPLLDAIKIDRKLVPEEFKNPRFSLHGFGDACEASYGGAVYLRVEDSNSARAHSTLLCSKTRVAPVGKKRSLPELELTASLVTARLVKYVESELKLPLTSVTCWTDSKVVLHWITQPAYTWQTFVANRVAEIQELVPPCRWKHIPGKINPADLCSRGITAGHLVESSLWWSGPSFLSEAESEWPKQDITSDTSAVKTANVKAKSKILTVCHVQRENQNLTEYVKKYSSFTKFIRVMTRVRSWVKKYRAKKEGINQAETSVIQDRNQEELFWVKWAQQSAFPAEIDQLKRNCELPKTSKLTHLTPVWDEKDEVVRVGGRLHYALLPEETRHPLILPSHNPFVELLVLHRHASQLHTGSAQTLASLRNTYWLIGGRQEIRRILNSCITCRKATKIEQKMAPLPLERTVPSSSFINVGTDFAGPLYVKVTGATVKTMYICLFTCMSSRAIHLELVQDLSTEQFLLALKRMMSRRGRARVIYSDNAKTFKMAANVVKRLFTGKNLREKLELEGIEWKFITERAPWHGGFYERMVGSVKRTLRKVLGKAQVTETELHTLLCEVESQINSRPLTVVSSETEDLSPLTPGHLTISRIPTLLPDVDKVTKEIPLGKRWAYQQRLSGLFWNRWVKEYMLELNYMKKWTSIQANVRVGDVVLIAEDNQRKQDWLLGRVEQVHPGRDHLIRSVTVKTTKGLRRRPVQRLRLLEAIEGTE